MNTVECLMKVMGDLIEMEFDAELGERRMRLNREIHRDFLNSANQRELEGFESLLKKGAEAGLLTRDEEDGFPTLTDKGRALFLVCPVFPNRVGGRFVSASYEAGIYLAVSQALGKSATLPV
jgi:hypothetical protein